MTGRHEMRVFVKKVGITKILLRNVKLETTLIFTNFGENMVGVFAAGTVRKWKFLDPFGFACKTKRYICSKRNKGKQEESMRESNINNECFS